MSHSVPDLPAATSGHRSNYKDAAPIDALSVVPSDAGKPDFSHLREAIDELAIKLVVLDDDPTGTQTVHGLEVLTEWSVASLEAALRDSRPAFFILTNARAHPEAEARRINREIASHLRLAALACGRDFRLASRSDSTLRGHFRAEVEELCDALNGTVDGVIVVPAFFEGGRYTIDDIHYLREGDHWVPVGDTEFARDETFGYRNSDLRLWIEEKMGGRVAARDVASFSLRHGGPAEVLEKLLALQGGRFAVVNAAGYPDLEIFIRALLAAERAGKRFLFRTAASFVRVRSGISYQTLLRCDTLNPARQPGLVVVGSYVQKTTEQLGSIIGLDRTRAFEIAIERFADPRGRKQEVDRVAMAAAQAMERGDHAIIYTRRELNTTLGPAGDLQVAAIVSQGLVDIVRAVHRRPGFIIAKGGITSSDLAVKALGVRRALILGQAAAGIPVWQLGPESLHPGLSYVVFPGNVGGPETLRDVLTELSR
jgi:uncharacterized protein YgbK (DUF1537 family)